MNNEPKLKKLLNFGREILTTCKSLDIEPVVYGSLAYFAHTKDTTLPIRDIDLLVPEAKFPELVKALRQLKGVRFEQKPYHSIEIFKDDLEIDLDSIEHFLDPRPRTTSNVTIENLALNILNRESLISIYQEALDNMPALEKLNEKRQRYTQKLHNLKSTKQL